MSIEERLDKLEKKNKRLKKVLGTLISWLFMEIGAANVALLLEELDKDV